jgi:hypothetical protein
MGKGVIATARQVDTSELFKQPVHCFRCNEAFYFTLRAIGEEKKSKCPVCGTGINLSDDGYRSLVASVRDTIGQLANPRLLREDRADDQVGRRSPVTKHSARLRQLVIPER